MSDINVSSQKYRIIYIIKTILDHSQLVNQQNSLFNNINNSQSGGLFGNCSNNNDNKVSTGLFGNSLFSLNVNNNPFSNIDNKSSDKVNDDNKKEEKNW